MASNDEPGNGELTSEEREAFKRRASELGARLEKVKAEHEVKSGRRASPDSPPSSAAGQAMRIAIELAVGLVVGGFIGRVLDEQLGTAPLLMIVLVMVGFAAGMLNVIRTAKKIEAEAAAAARKNEGGGNSVPRDN